MNWDLSAALAEHSLTDEEHANPDGVSVFILDEDFLSLDAHISPKIMQEKFPQVLLLDFLCFIAAD